MDENTPLILVGYSMGANTMVKYLGECGHSNTLPKNVIGAISLSNPFKIDHSEIAQPWEYILRLGYKRSLFNHRRVLDFCPHYKSNLKTAYLANSLAALTDISVPQMIRNEPLYPHSTSFGYMSVKDYWEDASSYRFISNISVPLVVAFAEDDDIAGKNTWQYINYGLANPNVIFINTSSGGHIGWHHAMRNSPFGSWKFYSRTEDTRDWGTNLVIKFVHVLIIRQFHESIAQQKILDRKWVLENSRMQSEKFQSKL